jgi:transposase-like protein
MRFSKEEKALWLEDWRQSGKSAWAYAKENGLCPQTFTRWVKLKTESNSCFVEIPAQVIPPLQFTQQIHQEILIEKGDVKIHIPVSLGCVELRAIFGTLIDAV